ncbi:M12 family metallopeptidase [uncultured Maricaulis sp.]|uniref:M12 family metallopeptidase n=1 Tax=uncultured Maricaulis sp. TaxID=174710 RepID=UPI00262BEB04|nr:M12 family metallopeptidase [uncultured Maricaulis sp.]
MVDLHHPARPDSRKWANGSTVRYGFLMRNPPSWTERKDIAAFEAALAEWLAPPCGLRFERTDTLADAQVRIRVKLTAPMRSRVGTDALRVTDPAAPTVSFNRSLRGAEGRRMALHEIGHILGFVHEHQSRRAALGWNVAAVEAHFGAPPMNWSREVIEKNVLEQSDDGRITGPDWDPASIMQYALPAGLLTRPDSWRNRPVKQADAISDADRAELRAWYPPD